MKLYINQENPYLLNHTFISMIIALYYYPLLYHLLGKKNNQKHVRGIKLKKLSIKDYKFLTFEG